MAEPDVRPPGAASSSAKSIQEEEIPLAVMAGRMKKFSENTIPEVMDSGTLNFNPNFKFFFSGGPRPLQVSTSKPWSISIVCQKNFGAQHPVRAEIYTRKKSIRV